MSARKLSASAPFSAWISTGVTTEVLDADKPWAVTGNLPGEVLLIARGRPEGTGIVGYVYQRSTDYGATWFPTSPASMSVATSAGRVEGYFCPQPALSPFDNSIVIAYPSKNTASQTGDQVIKFLRATDDDTPNSGVTFTTLPGEPTVGLFAADLTSRLPCCFLNGVKTSPGWRWIPPIRTACSLCTPTSSPPAAPTSTSF